MTTVKPLLFIWLTLVGVIVISGGLSVDNTLPTPQLVLPASVVSIHDGDTCTVDVVLRMNLRLLDCWAPEVTGKQKPEGLRSKKRLEELALGKEGMLIVPLFPDLGKATSMSRILGRLNIDGNDISETMVREKFATKTKVKGSL
mgnify:CR=1 FL=1